MRCVSMNWPSILVGETSSGKSSIVKLLADLTGNTLLTFHMNSAIDSTEILGGFEQFDINRHEKELVEITR